jgi:hypothetical protein
VRKEIACGADRETLSGTDARALQCAARSNLGSAFRIG